MTARRTQIDWDVVRQRLVRFQTQSAESGSADRNRLVEVFRKRARDLERRGRDQTANASRVSVVVFRLGKERFGVPLVDLKQVFPRVSITPIPGKRDLLLGVANLDGILRSVVDLNIVLNTSASDSDDGYIILLRAAERPLALWVESLEGVSEVDLTTLVAFDEVVSDKTASLVRGITESRIIILDSAAVISHVKQQLSDYRP